MLLFDGIEISNKHQKNEVKWKPNFYEEKEYPSSDDSFSYTQLDTVFFYEEYKTKKAVVIFATYVYENNKVINCHSCAPNISVATFKYDENSKEWKVDKFEKISRLFYFTLALHTWEWMILGLLFMTYTG